MMRYPIRRNVNLSTRILIVDDDAGIRSLVASFLEKHGFQVDAASHPAEMRERLAQAEYALIVLDVMMPGEDGLSALRELQRIGGPPVIMLSAVGTDIDRIVGLEIGAEDYLAKPCNPRELLARIRTVLRRTAHGAVAGGQPARAAPQSQQASAEVPEGQQQPLVLHFAGWRMDLEARQLHDPQDRLVDLSDGEFRLLRALVQHPRRVLTRDQLVQYALGAESDSYDRAIDVQVSRLRRKLASGETRADLIRTVRNEGYMFVPAVTRTREA
ncbi:DNA-binding response regulator, OmpR family, contains REC and winged-helix (wHTH) domain [Variovorax sp. NFACC28]|nr:DNA-binding response regulator, OmpR family, contains REC and winged-helix (wHTH) domain [Variovorax sp. NFACC28]SEG98483.1 DNA-binding response regulator, OmpR family, contains REC and winged-helix (wHTH) domain [Variovorax sp. NFACC29]SFE10891.1 DNA-binding response regulator, OmpR family, contains REC and winged-helix (wHTH) domain [Variovorax sp. NFACC26]SFH16408.1 DNA-binding response regulator, OmpR family, contains REC and winged-helix (wHTH) domain [Variovorax sp. NFACC27]